MSEELTLETIDKARKEVMKAKIQEGWMLIKRDWNTQIVLPLQDGMKFLDAIRCAEIVNHYYDTKPPAFRPLDKNSFEFVIIGHAEYCLWKMAQLLNVPVEDIKKTEEPPTE